VLIGGVTDMSHATICSVHDDILKRAQWIVKYSSDREAVYEADHIISLVLEAKEMGQRMENALRARKEMLKKVYGLIERAFNYIEDALTILQTVDE